MKPLCLAAVAALTALPAAAVAGERPPLRFSVASIGWGATAPRLDHDAMRALPRPEIDSLPIRLRDGPTGRVAQAGFRRQLDDATEFTAGPTWKPEDGADIRVLIGFRRALN